MMLNSIYSAAPSQQQQQQQQHQFQPYHTVESLLDDMSKQMASSNLTRKVSHSSRASGRGAAAMRIAKSTSNSPRNSTGLPRRRTVTNDGYHQPCPLAANINYLLPAGVGMQSPVADRNRRSHRPMSWHPSSQPATQISQTGYLIPGLEAASSHHAYPYAVVPPLFSGYISPVPTFAPACSAFDDAGGQGFSVAHTESLYDFSYNTNALHSASIQALSPQEIMTAAPVKQYGWDTYSSNINMTEPPTPENLMFMHNSVSAMHPEDSIPYNALDAEDSNDEVLVGMGLYDAPEKEPVNNTYFDEYHRNRLLTHCLEHQKPEPAGKGLKLEETWEPPSSDEEGDVEEGEEEDAESEDVDEEIMTSEAPVAHSYDRDQAGIATGYFGALELQGGTRSHPGWI